MSLIQTVGAQGSITLWDDNTDFVSIWFIVSAPPELDYGVGYGFENVDHTFIEYSVVKSGTLSAKVRDYYQETVVNDWAGIMIVRYDLDTFEINLVEVNEYLSIWIYGMETGSEIMMVLEQLDEEWETVGMSYSLDSAGDNFSGWKQLTFSLSDFSTYPGESPCDVESIGSVWIMFNKMIVYGSRYVDLLETGATAQETLSQNSSDAAGLVVSFLALALIVNLIYMIGSKSPNLLIQMILAHVFLMILLLILAAYFLTL